MERILPAVHEQKEKSSSRNQLELNCNDEDQSQMFAGSTDVTIALNNYKIQFNEIDN